MIIKPITLPMPYRMGSVNCYLLQSGSGYLLVDTGSPHNRQAITLELERAGCKPGSLQLIVITHGDFDHIGNAAYLRGLYDTKIAMHPADAGMAELGDMFYNRHKPNLLIKTLVPLFTSFSKRERFTPDKLLSDGDDLSIYGFDARIISIPGHSTGSIGILTGEQDFFCGDLLTNIEKPALSSLMDNLATARASLDRLESLGIRTVFPGHGVPFLFDTFRSATVHPINPN
jgi:glyoxylase-like metal-dependent hydrolase (beta-lactamase superfamily II)